MATEVLEKVTERSHASHQDDGELVTRAQGGDEAALDALMKRYLPVARATARQYFILGADHEDVTQEALIGLFTAVRDYDRSYGMPFGVFARECARRHVLTALRMGARMKHEPLNRSARELDVERAVVSRGHTTDTCNPADLVIASEMIDEMRRLVQTDLTDLEAAAWEMWLKGSSYREIADDLDWHMKKVDNALQRVRRKLKIHLFDCGMTLQDS